MFSKFDHAIDKLCYWAGYVVGIPIGLTILALNKLGIISDKILKD